MTCICNAREPQRGTRTPLTQRGELGGHRRLSRKEHQRRLRLLVHQRDEMRPARASCCATGPRQRSHALARRAADGLGACPFGQHPIDERVEQRVPIADVPVDARDREPRSSERRRMVSASRPSCSTMRAAASITSCRGERRRRDGGFVGPADACPFTPGYRAKSCPVSQWRPTSLTGAQRALQIGRGATFTELTEIGRRRTDLLGEGRAAHRGRTRRSRPRLTRACAGSRRSGCRRTSWTATRACWATCLRGGESEPHSMLSMPIS